ncbi:MAG: hypothetical protein IJK06_06840 [Clostridia bacterium]|nr:hypothetical protein [Clostridia bacterium]
MKRESGRANALLVELLLVIFFFMISAAILVQLFADARHRSIQARAATAAIAEAQNCAEDLYAEDDWKAYLEKSGFTRDAESGRWVREDTDYKLYIQEEFKTTDAGEIRTFQITGFGDGKDLFTIPSTRYVPTPIESEEVSK